MSNKKENKQKTIVVKERADGMKEVVITKSPSKTILGKVVIAALAFAMIAAVVFSLIIVLIQATK